MLERTEDEEIGDDTKGAKFIEPDTEGLEEDGQSKDRGGEGGGGEGAKKVACSC